MSEPSTIQRSSGSRVLRLFIAPLIWGLLAVVLAWMAATIANIGTVWCVSIAVGICVLGGFVTTLATSRRQLPK